MITIDHIANKYNACVAVVDKNKDCSTCKHACVSETRQPCASCLNMVIGFPINPINWEPNIPSR